MNNQEALTVNPFGQGSPTASISSQHPMVCRCNAACDPVCTQVTGDRMYNEGLIGAMTGLAGLAIITWTNAWEAYSASNLWLLGVVVPAGASIVLVQRLPWIQQAWHKYLQAGEQDR